MLVWEKDWPAHSKSGSTSQLRFTSHRRVGETRSSGLLWRLGRWPLRFGGESNSFGRCTQGLLRMNKSYNLLIKKKSDKNWLKRTVAKKLERGECFGEKLFCLVDRAESEEYNSIESRLWFYLNSIKVFLHNYPYFWTLMDRYFFVFLKLVRHHNLRLYKKKTAQHKY